MRIVRSLINGLSLVTRVAESCSFRDDVALAVSQFLIGVMGDLAVAKPSCVGFSL